MALQCLDNIIGITQTDCECEVGVLTTEQKDYFKKSVSGVYLDAIVEGFPNWGVFRDAFNCSNLYFEVIKHLTAAKFRIYNDIEMEFNRKMKTNLQPFLGTLGETTFSSLNETSNSFRGLKISDGASSGVLSLNSIRLNVTTATSVDVILVSKKQGSPYQVLKTWAGATTGSGFSSIMQTKEELPLCENDNPIQYFLLYQVNGAEVNNKLDCNCSSTTLDKKYMRVEGVSMASLTDIENTTYTLDSSAHGLSVDIQLRCETGQLICKNFDVNNKGSKSLTIALALKTANLLINAAISTNKIGAHTLISREELQMKADYYDTEHCKYLSYAIQNLDFRSTDCFFCDSSMAIMGTIELATPTNRHESFYNQREKTVQFRNSEF